MAIKDVNGVIAALRETLAPFDTSNCVWALSSKWFISARNPN